MLTCVSDILSIDQIRVVTGFAVNFDTAGVNWPHKFGSHRSATTDID